MDDETLRSTYPLHKLPTLAAHYFSLTLLSLQSLSTRDVLARFTVVLSAVCLLFPLSLRADDSPSVNVAVAANFAKPLREIASEFTQLTGIDVVITVSSSGTLFAQIQHGAKFDVFLSADQSRPQALVDAHLVHVDNLVNFALGRLAFVYTDEINPSYGSEPEVSPTQFLKIFERSMSVANAKLAMANPKLAPYGVAAEQALKRMEMWDFHQQKQNPKHAQIKRKPASAWFTKVKGKNVLQAYQFYSTGSVSGAFVAYSQTRKSKGKRAGENSILVPGAFYSPIIQSLIVNDKSAAQLFPNMFDETDEQEIPLDEESAEKFNDIASSHLFAQYVLSQKVQKRLPEWGYLPAVAAH